MEKIATLSTGVRNETSIGPEAPNQTTIRPPWVVDAGTQKMSDAPTIIAEAVKFANRVTTSNAGVSTSIDG